MTPALDGIFAAFETHPLVGLGEAHHLAQGIRFYETLVSDPRFAREVGNVVVEFGGAAHQDVIDRYVNGEDIPYTQLRQVWTDTVGWTPFIGSAYYAHFFYRVRLTNLTLPPDERIKVWLGEPPIDWASIGTNDQWRQIATQRDWHAGAVIVENILEQNEKALVIYGSGHFEPHVAEESEFYAEWIAADPAAALGQSRALQKVVEDRHPGAFFVAHIYIGLQDEACTQRIEQSFGDWPLPALATPIRNTTLERELRSCLTLPPDRIERSADLSFPPTMPQGLQDYILENPDAPRLLRGDAIVVLAPAADLTLSPRLSDVYLDEEYRREISRRLEVMVGETLPADYGRNLPGSMAFTERDR